MSALLADGFFMALREEEKVNQMEASVNNECPHGPRNH